MPKLKSQDFPAVVLSIMVALGMEDKYLDKEVTVDVQASLAGLYMLWHTLKRTWYSRDEVTTRLPELIERWVAGQHRSHSWHGRGGKGKGMMTGC